MLSRTDVLDVLGAILNKMSDPPTRTELDVLGLGAHAELNSALLDVCRRFVEVTITDAILERMSHKFYTGTMLSLDEHKPFISIPGVNIDLVKEYPQGWHVNWHAPRKTLVADLEDADYNLAETYQALKEHFNHA